MAQNLAIVSAVAGADPERMIWGTPLALIGSLVAQSCVKSGEKGVERRKDYSKALKKLDETVKRKKNGNTASDIRDRSQHQPIQK